MEAMHDDDLALDLPTGEERLALFRDAVRSDAALVVQGDHELLIVDTRTVRALVSVADALQGRSRETFLALDFGRMVDLARKLVLC